MKEDKVTEVVMVGVFVLLFTEPSDGLRCDAGLTGQAFSLAPVARRVQSVDAKHLRVTIRVHDRNPRRKIAEFFLVRPIDMRIISMHIPDVARP